MTKPRAVICDVYRTLLDVLPRPVDAERQWEVLASSQIGGVPCALDEVTVRCRDVIRDDHALAESRGVAFPEVVWPDVMRRALGLTDTPGADFLFDHMQLLRGLRLMPGAAEFLGACREHGIVLGIASNAQRYTLRELAEAMAAADLGADVFDPEFVLWSWQMGFSKPNPHVFQVLSARLANRGIAPADTLMIGDRLDNDIEPARRFGWRTAHVVDGEESWRAFRAELFGEP